MLIAYRRAPEILDTLFTVVVDVDTTFDPVVVFATPGPVVSWDYGGGAANESSNSPSVALAGGAPYTITASVPAGAGPFTADLTNDEVVDITDISTDITGLVLGSYKGGDKDFKVFTNLTTLNLNNAGSSLDNLDVSGMTSLTSLSFLFSTVETVNVAGCTSLSNCQVGFSAINAAQADQVLIDLDANGLLSGTVRYDVLPAAASDDSSRSDAGAQALANLLNETITNSTGPFAPAVNTKSWTRVGTYNA